MQQDPHDTIKRHKAFFITPYVQADTYKVPFIGIYGSPYVLQDLLARIKFDPRMIDHAPESIKKLVPPGIQDLSFNVMIHNAEPKTYNMVFHMWAGTWQPTKLFNINVDMGILAPNGVQPASSNSIPFNQITAQNVHVHDGGKTIANSPNNARFTVTPQRDISTFWSIAISPNKRHAVVTFHILSNTIATENMIEAAVRQANTLGDFLKALEKGAATLQRPIDQQALQEAVRTIETMIAPPLRVAPAPAPIPQKTLEDALETLARQLTRLEGRLQ